MAEYCQQPEYIYTATHLSLLKIFLQEGRLVQLLPFCVNSTDLYNRCPLTNLKAHFLKQILLKLGRILRSVILLSFRLDELGCDADFLQGVLPPGAGILANTTTCRWSGCELLAFYLKLSGKEACHIWQEKWAKPWFVSLETAAVNLDEANTTWKAFLQADCNLKWNG